ncbi:Uncharacterised protein g6827 [Pycnogonum litorale]
MKCVSRSTIFVTLNLCLAFKHATSTYPPKFLDKMKNITAVVGSDVQFTCSISNLGDYRVAWYHVEKKQVLAVHKQRIAYNDRFQLYHSYPSHWVLKIKGVRLSDQGHYMCQINTVPMMTLEGFLKLQVPPDIVDAKTSSNVIAAEGFNVTLVCKATGIPVPKIIWRREDSRAIALYDRNGKRHSVKEYPEDKLHFYGVSREHMGAYLCIASNGVPPSISRTINLNINFPPALKTPNQLIGTPLNTEVVLTCFVQSYPDSIIYWENNSGSVIGNITGSYRVQFKKDKRSHRTEAKLVITNVQQEHYGAYKCKAENHFGSAEDNVRLYEITQPSDSRSRLAINDNQGVDSQHPKWTEQVMSVKEDFKDSGISRRLPSSTVLATTLTILNVLRRIS